MDIGWAVATLENAGRVSRPGWNGKGMWLTMVPLWSAYGMGCPPEELLGIGLLPFVAMRTADGNFVPWLCSQTDLLAKDWEIVP